ncbi:MAG TPA: hypothetical protein VKN99_03545 [Polyangia bacterium]|nr:hypothetical protein [Polyangia bacterium]
MTYRLDRLLELRRQAVMARARELSDAERAEDALREKLEAMDAARTAAQQRTPRTAGDAVKTRHYTERLAGERAQQADAVRAAAAATRAARKALAEARADCDALERHREHAVASERLRRGRREASEADDLAGRSRKK